jgi:outer membrane immunogenic protein
MEFIAMRKFLFAALAATVLATPAMAQGRGPFTGVRVEGLVGWDRPQSNGDHADGVAYGVGARLRLPGRRRRARRSRAKRLGFDRQGVRRQLRHRRRPALQQDRPGPLCRRPRRRGGRPLTLLYAKAGYTNARAKATYNSNLAGVDDRPLHDNLDGVRVGAGIEQAVGRKAFVKAEYRYSNYEQGVDRHQVVAGLGIRF